MLAWHGLGVARADAGGVGVLMQTAKRVVRALLPQPIYRLYRQRRVAWGVAHYARREVVHSYGSTTLTIELADALAEGWYDHDWPPLPELERLREHGLVPGARVFDIGAHQGVVALMLADAVGPSGHVLAVEAEPHNARMAERNRVRNEVANVEVLHAAGAASRGSLMFAEGLNGRVDEHAGRLGKVEVPAVTVDDLAKRYGSPAVVLVDVEGFEGHVLTGAQATIVGRRTTFLVEVHVGHGLDRPPEEIVAAFGSGYAFLVAPAWGESDRFEELELAADTLAERFFLLAAPAPASPS